LQNCEATLDIARSMTFNSKRLGYSTKRKTLNNREVSN